VSIVIDFPRWPHTPEPVQSEFPPSPADTSQFPNEDGASKTMK